MPSSLGHWAGRRSSGFSYKQDPASSVAETANTARGTIIAMAAHGNTVNRRRMHHDQHTQSLNKKASLGWAGWKLGLQSWARGRCECCLGREM